MYIFFCMNGLNRNFNLIHKLHRSIKKKKKMLETVMNKRRKFSSPSRVHQVNFMWLSIQLLLTIVQSMSMLIIIMAINDEKLLLLILFMKFVWWSGLDEGNEYGKNLDGIRMRLRLRVFNKQCFHLIFKL